MAIENLTTYTEVDPRSEITVSSSRVTFTNARNVACYVYKDFGANFFNGNFVHEFTVSFTSGSNTWEPFICWQLANSVGPSYLGLFVQMRNYGSGVRILALDPNDPININNGGVYYVRVRRDESIGTYGRLYLEVYSDSARTNLVGSKYKDLTAKDDFRYYYAFSSENAGTSYYASGYIENVDLKISSPANFLQLF